MLPATGAAAPLAYPLGWKKGGCRPLAGTSTRRADVMIAGPPGAASRLSAVSAAHFCASALGNALGAFCAAKAEPLRPANAMRPIQRTLDKLQTRLGSDNRTFAVEEN